MQLGRPGGADAYRQSRGGAHPAPALSATCGQEPLIPPPSMAGRALTSASSSVPSTSKMSPGRGPPSSISSPILLPGWAVWYLQHREAAGGHGCTGATQALPEGTECGHAGCRFFTALAGWQTGTALQHTQAAHQSFLGHLGQLGVKMRLPGTISDLTSCRGQRTGGGPGELGGQQVSKSAVQKSGCAACYSGMLSCVGTAAEASRRACVPFGAIDKCSRV